MDEENEELWKLLEEAFDQIVFLSKTLLDYQTATNHRLADHHRAIAGNGQAIAALTAHMFPETKWDMAALREEIKKRGESANVLDKPNSPCSED